MRYSPSRRKKGGSLSRTIERPPQSRSLKKKKKEGGKKKRGGKRASRYRLIAFLAEFGKREGIKKRQARAAPDSGEKRKRGRRKKGEDLLVA